jgi:flavin-dependent dehydrogenase
VLDAGQREGWRVGESLSPAARPALARLGLLDLLAQHPPSHGSAAAWGSDDVTSHGFVTDAYGSGRHLDRAAFDRALADAAVDAGATWRAPEPIRHVARAGGAWEVGPMRAAYVVDATGPAARVARSCGARRRRLDRLAGVAALLPAARTGERVSFVESVPAGWWYAAPVPGDAYAVLAMTDADLVRGTYPTPAAWWAALRATRALWPRLADAGVAGPPESLRVLRAATGVTVPAAGPGWAAVGDAAFATDPLAARGLLTALGTAVAAGEAVVAAHSGDTGALPRYAAHTERAYAEFVAARTAVYAREARWSTPFWARRRP